MESGGSLDGSIRFTDCHHLLELIEYMERRDHRLLLSWFVGSSVIGADAHRCKVIQDNSSASCHWMFTSSDRLPHMAIRGGIAVGSLSTLIESGYQLLASVSRYSAYCCGESLFAILLG